MSKGNRLRSSLVPGLLLLLTTAPAVSEPVDTHIVSTRHLSLYSDPWLNLHHFLYQWARADKGIGKGRQAVHVAERSELDALPQAAGRQWRGALDFYRRHVAREDRFSRDMLLQKVELLQVEGDTDAVPKAVIDGIDVALRTAMPVYIGHWWPRHDQQNRQWTATTVEYLSGHEQRFIRLMERIYGTDWPADKRRIDVSAYANFRAGYTAWGHTVIYSNDPGIQGLYGLETLLHEIQHTRDLNGAVRLELKAAFDAANIALPPNLSHAIIFATAGQFTRSVADAKGRPPHEPYWIREGFSTFSGWEQPVIAVRRYWLPVVAGEALRDAAIAKIVGHFEELQNAEKSRD